jgi:hypothetical protein
MATKNDTELYNEIVDRFYYKDGNLHYKQTLCKRVQKDSVAGTLRKDNRKQVIINKRHYLLHRLIYLYHNKTLPTFIDHIDGNPLNNKIENLREATKEQNGWNRVKSSNNVSGTKNVFWHTQSKRWRVVLTKNKVKIHIGTFIDLELAELVAIEANNKYYKEYSKYGY